MILETPQLHGCRLRINFRWTTDRFVHQLHCLTEDRVIPLMSSVEGRPNEHWPSSPPFQQLSIEGDADEGQVAFLVGMAGKSYWSASIKAAADLPLLEFDVACRTSELAVDLGSLYRLDVSDGAAQAQRPQVISLQSSAHWRAELTAGRLGDGLGCELHHDESQVKVSLSQQAGGPQKTQRWKYAVRVIELREG